MSEKKGWTTSLKGLFVEPDEPRADAEPEPPADAEAASDEARSASARPSASAPSSPSVATPRGPAGTFPAQPAGAPPGKLDFAAIYTAAGIGPEEQERVAKAAELLHALPEGTDAARHIVEASLKAFGFEIAKIVQAAHNQKKAIDTYVRVNETGTAKAIQDAEAQIHTLNEKIAALRADIEKRTAGLSGLNASAQARKAEVQKVIDFFQGPQAPGQPPQP